MQIFYNKKVTQFIKMQQSPIGLRYQLLLLYSMLISVVQYSTANVLYISASVELSYTVVCGLVAPDIFFRKAVCPAE